jgi:DNA methyltransferase 1-associated protein 1
VSLRSQRIKLPPNVGQRRSKAIDQMLVEVQVEAAPTPTEEICTGFNELRYDFKIRQHVRHLLT